MPPKNKPDKAALETCFRATLREAEQSLDSLSDNIRAAFGTQLKAASPLASNDWWVTEVYADHVIVRAGDDYLSVPFTEAPADTDPDYVFDLAGATKVERQWVTAAEAVAALEVTTESKGVKLVGEADSWLLDMVEAADVAKGSEWDVVLIRAGESKNGKIYPEKVLAEAAPLFEGVRVLARDDAEHLAGTAKSVKNTVGWIDGVSWDAKKKAVVGRFHVSEAADWLRTMLSDAWSRGKKDLVGLSIVAAGTGKSVTKGGKRKVLVEAITTVSSTDVVFDPAAGGGLLKLVAAVGKESPVDEKYLKLLRGLSDTALYEAAKKFEDGELEELREADGKLADRIDALEEPAAPAKADDKTTKLAEAAADEDEDDKVPANISRFIVREALADTKLPEVSKKKITDRFSGKSFSEVDLTEAVKGEIDMFAELEKEGLVKTRGTSRGGEVEVTLEEADKGKAALDGFFLKEDVSLDGEKVPRFRSFKEAYMRLTGDGLEDGILTGQLPKRPIGLLGISEANGGAVQLRLHEQRSGGLVLTEAEDGSKDVVLSEAISTSGFNTILGDSVTRAMVKEYLRSDLNVWRPLADVVPVSDFRTQRRERFGGYANLPGVAQAGSYVALTSPTNEEATYAATKRGGLETINLEAIVNDDIGALQRIPKRLARAAAQTLYEFVFDFLRANAAIYDSVALVHATHANIGSVALSVASLAAARLRMQKQAEMDNSKRLGLVPKHLWVPLDLEQLAYELTASDRKPGTADNDANFIRSTTLDYQTVNYWTDTNNWFVTADVDDTPVIEMGFYGPEEPQLFTQDMPNVGSMFNADQLTYKIRHIYSGAVIDFRGIDGSIVA